MFHDGDLSELPEEAFDPFDVDGPFEPQNHWLRTADEELQLIAMREWFKARYCDPAESTPYSSAEGGYLFIFGGPFSPSDELQARFGQIVTPSVIEQAVAELVAEVGEDWAPVLRHPPDFDYDDRYEIILEGTSSPKNRLDDRLSQALAVLTLRGDAEVEILARSLVFGAVFSALEAYLWETVLYWVENDDDTVKNFITQIPRFSEEPMKLGQIYAQQTKLREHVKGYLQKVVWHQFEKVAQFYRRGLGVELPSMKHFSLASQKRHHIIHRSGQDMDGISVSVDVSEIEELTLAIRNFAGAIEGQLEPRKLLLLERLAHTL